MLFSFFVLGSPKFLCSFWPTLSNYEEGSLFWLLTWGDVFKSEGILELWNKKIMCWTLDFYHQIMKLFFNSRLKVEKIIGKNHYWKISNFIKFSFWSRTASSVLELTKSSEKTRSVSMKGKIGRIGNFSSSFQITLDSKCRWRISPTFTMQFFER